jgi:hypothetical protein
MRRRNFKYYFVVGTVILFFACGDDDSTPTEPDGNGNGSNVVEITENITEVTTWSGDSIYVIKRYDFYVSNTLSIEPGTIVKFTNDGPYLMLGSPGTIVANGTVSNPIIFTSIKDDEHGGDTNGDGDLTNPAVNDWGCINTNGQNGSIFNYCHFYYGGNTTYTYTLAIEAGSIASVINCTFAHNNGSDGTGWYAALSASSAAAGTVIRNNIFYNNIRPLSITDQYNIDDSNIFHNPANPDQKNIFNGIFLYTQHITRNISWQETEVAFVIDDNDWWVNSGYSLLLADNVVIKFKSGSTMLLQDGASSLVNHDGSGVYFTSYKDDNLKGDTNGDGNVTSPSNNDWLGIYDDSMSIPSPYFFQWSNILYDSY